MSDKPKVLGVTGGAVALSALALAFGACCVAPWAVGLPHPAQFPHLDASAFAAKVHTMVDSLGRTAVSQ